MAETLVDWSMTWLLVSTRPVEEMTMPVPSAVAPLYLRSEVMSTRPGSTLADSALAFSEPVPLLVPPVPPLPPLPVAAEAAEAAAAERVGLGAAAGPGAAGPGAAAVPGAAVAGRGERGRGCRSCG